MSENTRICPCATVVQILPIVDTTGFQNSANMVYESKRSTVTASTNGTLGNSATGNPTFKSDFERMQYLLGRNNRGGCGGALTIRPGRLMGI
jgi:hypothetical protein